MPGQGRALEPGDGPAAEQLVAGAWPAAMNPRIDGTLAAVEAPSRRRVPPMHEQVRRRPGEDDGDAAEDRPELHDPVMPQPIREQAERRRQDELGDEERREQDPRAIGLDLLPAVLGGSLAR